MIDNEKIKSFSAAELVEELIKTAMVVNDISKNDHAPESVRKAKKAELKQIKQELLRRLGQPS